MTNYEVIPQYVLSDTKDWLSFGENVGKLVVSGINMLPIQSVTIATEQTIAGYTFTEVGTSLATSTFATTVASIVSTLATIGAVIAVVMVVQSYLSAWAGVDSIKRKRDKVLNMFRRIKRLNRIADINKIVYGNMEQYLQQKFDMLTQYQNKLNDNNLIVRDFIGAKTNTYLLSNPIINYLNNEQNVLDIIKTNDYNYIKVVSFKEYVKDLDILELDKIRIAQADINTTKTYIDNLNALLVLIDKLENYKLYPQVIDDINFIKENTNILLKEINKTYIEQLNTQKIDNPLKMLEEITNDIPFLDLSAQTYDIGGLSFYPTEYIANDIPLMLNTLNKKDLMILIFNNIYIKKFILLMVKYYLSLDNLSKDLEKYIKSSINTFNYLSQIISLKSVSEKYYNQQLPDNVNVDRYRIFVYLKKLFISKTINFLSNFKFTYRKSNNVKVSNTIKVNDKLFDFNSTKYSFNDFIYYFDFDIDDINQKINNIDINTIEIDNLQEKYFNYINDIKQELFKYGIEFNIEYDIYITIFGKNISVKRTGDKINNFSDFVYYIYNILQQIQNIIDTSYENCKYTTYTYSFNILNFENKLIETNSQKDIRIKECIFVKEEIDKKIEELEAKLYQIRQDYKYEYSVFSDLFLSETSYFLFELFTKLETITNSSVSLIKQTQLSVNNAGYNINFYEILFKFFTKYLNNYSGYIYSKNNYLNSLTTIAQCNFVSVLQIACDYKSIEVKINNLEKDIITLKQTEISQTQLQEILNLSTDIETSDILANSEFKEPNIKNNSIGKVAITLLGVALLSN